MSVQYYPNGIGGTAPGDSLDLARPLQTSGNVWYVSSLIGTDAAAPAGQNREKPLATVAQAVTNAAADDIIVFLPGHTQTLTAVQTLGKALTLIGEGTTSGKPAVSFLMNAVATNIFNITAAFVELRNIYFPPNVQANASPRVSVGNVTDSVVRGCYFECGATDTGYALAYGGNSSRARIEACTVISTATLTSAQPGGAIQALGTLTGMTIKDTVVSAGTVGFAGVTAVSLTGAISFLRVEGLSLLLGADMDCGSASATGRINVQLSTGGSRVAWS